GVGGSQHVAAAVENSSRINHHARRVHLPGDHALGLNLDPALRENHAVEAARNHHAVPFDLPFDFCAVAENHGLLGNDVASDVAIDAERALDREGAFEGHALIDESCPLFTGCAVAFAAAGPLPCHIEFSQIS